MVPSRSLIVSDMSALWLYIGLPQVPQNTLFLLGLEKYAFNDPDSLVKVHFAKSIGALVTMGVPCAHLH